MKVKLTKSVVDASKPAASEYEMRDTVTPGLMVRVMPSGHKTFMLSYRTNAGSKRRPKLGRVGEITVEQARRIAQDLLAEARRGRDPSADRAANRAAPTVSELCDRFIQDYSIPKNRPRTVKGYAGLIKRKIKPQLGTLKVRDVTRSHVSDLMVSMKATPRSANHMLCCLRKMMNVAEVWGYRDDGTNPCRHVPKYPENGRTRLLNDAEVGRIFAYLDRAERERLEHPTLTLAIRLQFAFAARVSEILELRWEWIDFVHRRVIWPYSKTGSMSKPLSGEALDLFSRAARAPDAIYVVPALSRADLPLSYFTYSKGWCRVLERAGVPHVGTHGIRHRAATEIANSVVPIKVGMQLTAHKTVSQFMQYVHTEDDAVRAAAERIAALRSNMLASRPG